MFILHINTVISSKTVLNTKIKNNWRENTFKTEIYKLYYQISNKMYNYEKYMWTYTLLFYYRLVVDKLNGHSLIS